MFTLFKKIFKINLYPTKLQFITYSTLIILLLVLDWGSLFIVNVLIIVFCLLSLNYISTFGLVLISFSQTLIIALKTWFLLAMNLWESSRTMYWYFGSYSSITNISKINLTLFLDTYNLSYITLTFSIGCWAILYAYNYMRNEPRIFSFIWLLVSFLYSMVLLLSGNSFTTILLGWELIGSFSFLLINFWTTRVSTFKAALKAFFFNKLSDLALLCSLIIIFFYHSSDYTQNMNLISNLIYIKIYIINIEFTCATILLLLLSVCCFCKSAQFGFHVWLPDSMEAPVPASALIHSATLVSAGIYLFGRVPSYAINEVLYNYILIVSSFTAFYGGIIAAYQTDLKKVLAYSTISHCGFLFFLLTLDNYYNLFIYLHLHGWFKSLSFMCAGNIIGSANNYQDYRRISGRNSSIKFEQLILTISILNLGSLPFLLGFFNKHYLLILFNNTNSSLVSSIFILLASLTGVFYSIKFIYGIFYTLDKRNISIKLNNSLLFNNNNSYNNSSGSQILNVISLVVLSFLICFTSLLILLKASTLNDINQFFDYYSNTTLLFYINIYILIFCLTFYYRTFRGFFFIIFLTFLKLTYLC